MANETGMSAASRCSYCENSGDPYRNILKVQVSRGSFRRPLYVNDPGDGWSYDYHERPYPFSKSSRKSFTPSKSKKTGENISVYRFLMNALAASSINGVSNWAQSKKGIWKFLWFLVIVGCAGGYGYQTFTFYSRYLSSPTVVMIQVENDGQVEFPAVTICNANRFRKSAFCQLFKENCTSDTKNLTITESQMNEVVYKLLLEKKGQLKKELGHQKCMIETCTFEGYPIVSEKECISILQELYDPDFGNCYTIPAKNIDGLPLEAREGDFWQETNYMTVLVNVEPEEYMETKRQPGIYIVVHDEKTQPDIHTDGLFLTPGHSYSIGVRKSTVLLLPLPYKLNCTNYKKLPWQKGIRRLTSRMCTVGCSQYFQDRECKYVTKNLSLFYDNLPYEEKDITAKSMKCAAETEDRMLEYCRGLCGLPCRDSMFSARIESIPLSKKIITTYNQYNAEIHRNKSLEKSMVHAKVFYASFEHKIYKHTPKYDTMELFSFLGGYSGVWLGFSLLTVFEILEITISTLSFAVCKLRRYRQNSAIRDISQSRRASTNQRLKTFKPRKFYK